MLLFELAQLGLVQFQLLLGAVETLVEFGTGLGAHRGDADCLVLQQLVGFAG